VSRETIRPEITAGKIGQCDDHDIYRHPAFGVITLMEPTGHAEGLFGSDVQHSRCMKITIHRAELHRNLSNDWIHDRETLVVVELSHAQFAEFITSKGKGDGTPCTLRYTAPEGSRLEQMPGIAMPETKTEMFRREIEESAKERLTEIRKQIDRLGAMIEEGRLAKRDLRDMHAELLRHAQQLPGSVGFVIEQAQEALEHATTAAKIEVEAYIGQAVQRIGMDAARNIGLIENKGERS
jgi:hypothetical protein